METGFKCYKINLNSNTNLEEIKSTNDLEDSINLSKRRYQIIQVRYDRGNPIFLIKNLETDRTKEFVYAEVKLYFFSEYLEFMQAQSKKKVQKI